MGCGPSRATEASAYGVDATGCVLDEPSAGRQTRACSRGEDARPHPEAPTTLVRRDGPSAPPATTARSGGAADGRSPRDVPSPSAPMARLARRDAPAGVRGVAAGAAAAESPRVHRKRQPRCVFHGTTRLHGPRVFAARGDGDVFVWATSPSLDLRSAFGSIAIEPNTVTVSDVSNADTNADTDDDAAYPQVLAAAAAAVGNSPDAVRVAAVPRNTKHEKKKFSAFDEDGEDFDESVFAFRRSETDAAANGFSSCPGVGATTRRARRRRRRPRWTSFLETNERAGREKGAAIRF